MKFKFKWCPSCYLASTECYSERFVFTNKQNIYYIKEWDDLKLIDIFIDGLFITNSAPLPKKTISYINNALFIDDIIVHESPIRENVEIRLVFSINKCPTCNTDVVLIEADKEPEKHVLTPTDIYKICMSN